MSQLHLFAPLALAIGFAGCLQTPPEPRGERLAITVAPLELPNLSDVQYTLVVRAGGQPVWTRSIRSSAYGDGAGAIAYVGPCDADYAQNTVELTIDALEVDGVALTSGLDYANPAPAGAPLTQTAACAADRDTAVAFDLTVARSATQGFFDVAVSFEDLFCSAKLDCQQDGAGGPEPLALLFHPHTGARDLTAVLALACTAGPDAPASTLHLDDLVIGCTNGATFSVSPDLGPGNLDPTFPGPPNTTHLLFQAAVFRGDEPLAGAHKAYWNVALGLNEAAFATLGACTLTTAGTATSAPLADGWTRPGAAWPFVAWNVPLFSAGGATRCTRHGFGDDNGVGMGYTALEGAQFAASFAPSLPGAPTTRHIDPMCGGAFCDAAAGCVGPIDHCACEAGYVGDGESCADLDACAAAPCYPGVACTDDAPPSVGFSCGPCPSGTAGDGQVCANVDACAPNPCYPGVACTDDAPPGTGYTCAACPSGMTGDGETCVPAAAPTCASILAAGQSTGNGIYAIDPDGPGGAAPYNVYCDMTSAGGGWTLIAYWVGGTESRSFGQVAVAGRPLVTLTTNAAAYPVLPTGTLNTFTEQLLAHGNATWTSFYGAWVKYPMFAQGFTIGSAGFAATRANGTAVTLYPASGGWGNAANETTYFGLFNVWGNGGTCGGANVCANKNCPAFSAPYSCHFDQSSPKLLFGR